LNVWVLLDFVSRYVVKDLVGSGTFGQVAKCFTEETNEYVAVKVIKNLPAYTTQARFEIGILHMVWLSLHDYLSRFFNPSLGLNLS
jgi:serine/threonine protein kinase